MTTSTAQIDLAAYQKNGFVLMRGMLSDEDFQSLESMFLQLAAQRTGRSYHGLDDPELVSAICEDRELERHLYDAVQADAGELISLASRDRLSRIPAALIGCEDVVLLQKIPFRIDCPLVMRELAVWHQDHHYVKGDPNTITAWIPLQDTTFREGCLMVMPGSHALGPIPHDVNVLKKKYYPSTIFDREVRYVEIKRGDVLFFHGCLLHSSGNNIGEQIRYSLQARYVSAEAPSDPWMGERIPV